MMDFPFGKKSPGGGGGPSLWKAEGNFRTSLTEGSSKLFGSMKNGLIDGISSKFDQVVNIVGGGEEEDSEEEKAAAAAQPRHQPQPQPRPQPRAPDQPKQRPGQPAPKQRPPGRPPAPRQGSTSSNGSVKQYGGVKRQNSAPVGYENQYSEGGFSADAPGGAVSDITPKPSDSQTDADQASSRYPPRPKPMLRRNTNPFLNEDGSLIEDDAYQAPGTQTNIFSTADGSRRDELGNLGPSFLGVQASPKDLLAITPTSGEALPPPQIEPQRAPHHKSDHHTHHNEDVVYDADSDADSEATEGCDEVPDVEYDPERDYEDSMLRSGSVGSDQSWTSADGMVDEMSRQCMEFMKMFVEKIFDPQCSITPLDKAQFGHLCQQSAGRLWFARYVNAQRVDNKRVSEQTFYGLVQHFAITLFECYEAEDFVPAKTLMNMCFTFYFEAPQPSGATLKHLLYSYLKDQPIWQSIRFWNAAFFDAVQQERARRPLPARGEDHTGKDEREFQENITFGQLGTFTCNMRAFGLSKELCLEFLRKQSTIANLREEQVQMLRQNISRGMDQQYQQN